MKLKDSSVKLEGASWRIWHAAIITEEVLNAYGAALVLTSVRDGKHKAGSKHYDGLAFDARTWKLKAENKEAEVVAVLKKRLGPDYDVVLEGDHIHIEHDPK
jgi:hypothetical protein